MGLCFCLFVRCSGLVCYYFWCVVGVGNVGNSGYFLGVWYCYWFLVWYFWELVVYLGCCRFLVYWWNYSWLVYLCVVLYRYVVGRDVLGCGYCWGWLFRFVVGGIVCVVWLCLVMGWLFVGSILCVCFYDW